MAVVELEVVEQAFVVLVDVETGCLEGVVLVAEGALQAFDLRVEVALGPVNQLRRRLSRGHPFQGALKRAEADQLLLEAHPLAQPA